MLLDFLEQICVELTISPPPMMDDKKTVLLQIGQEIVEIRDLQPGFSLAARICPCPEKNREELFLKLSKANYLGQETGPTRIGLSLDEKDLTLSLGMPYEMTYRVFREYLEDFVNFILHWRKEVETFKTLETLL